ncbi:hypothetical protein CAPTEDRAFT_137702, partial [Capitella teleta]
AQIRENNSWIEVDLLENRFVGGIVTWGRRHGSTQYVETFKIEYRIDGSSDWTKYTDISGSLLTFAGNEDTYQPVLNDFAERIVARYIRLYPLSWEEWPTMRWELLGCAKCKFSHLTQCSS